MGHAESSAVRFLERTLDKIPKAGLSPLDIAKLKKAGFIQQQSTARPVAQVLKIREWHQQGMQIEEVCTILGITKAAAEPLLVGCFATSTT